MSEKTEGAIKNGESIETGNPVHRKRWKTKQKHNTICVGHHSSLVSYICKIISKENDVYGKFNMTFKGSN